MDLFRYSAPGQIQLSSTGSAYFSIDGGKTNLNNYDAVSDPGDWASSVNNDAFGYGISDEILAVTATDINELNVIGFKVTTFPAATVQADYLAITRTPLSLDAATSVANAINAGIQTETEYVSSLLSQVANTTIPAVAVEGSMYNSVGSSAEVTKLVTQYLPPQVATAIQYGYNPQVYACEVLGLAFAFGDENGGTGFANNFGPSNSAMPATTAGDTAFANAAASTIFGSGETANTPGAILTFVTNWEAFYTHNGIPGNPTPTLAQIDLAARGAAWGDALGIALANNLGAFVGETTNFLEDAAQGTAIYSASLGSQPTHVPFQGAATATAAMSQAQLIGIGGPIDHPVI